MSTSYKLIFVTTIFPHLSAMNRSTELIFAGFALTCQNYQRQNSYNTGSRRDIFAVKLFAFAKYRLFT